MHSSPCLAQLQQAGLYQAAQVSSGQSATARTTVGQSQGPAGRVPDKDGNSSTGLPSSALHLPLPTPLHPPAAAVVAGEERIAAVLSARASVHLVGDALQGDVRATGSRWASLCRCRGSMRTYMRMSGALPSHQAAVRPALARQRGASPNPAHRAAAAQQCSVHFFLLAKVGLVAAVVDGDAASGPHLNALQGWGMVCGRGKACISLGRLRCRLIPVSTTHIAQRECSPAREGTRAQHALDTRPRTGAQREKQAQHGGHSTAGTPSCRSRLRRTVSLAGTRACCCSRCPW